MTLNQDDNVKTVETTKNSAVGKALSEQLDLSPRKMLPVWPPGINASIFTAWLECFDLLPVCIHHIDSLLNISCWYFLGGDIMPLLYCLRSSSSRQTLILWIQTVLICIYSILKLIWILYVFTCVFVSVSDGGVWESSLQKASFPSGPVDQLTQEALC